MRRGLLGRLFSAMLMLVMASGGGSLPTLDGLLFHSRDRGSAASQAHYEASGACHSDGCTIRSTAHQARLAPVGTPVGSVVSAPESVADSRLPEVLRSSVLFAQTLSRAPPSFS
jgi:hypothetical protein